MFLQIVVEEQTVSCSNTSFNHDYFCNISCRKICSIYLFIFFSSTICNIIFFINIVSNKLTALTFISLIFPLIQTIHVTLPRYLTKCKLCFRGEFMFPYCVSFRCYFCNNTCSSQLQVSSLLMGCLNILLKILIELFPFW